MAVWSSFASKNIKKLETAKKLFVFLKNGPTGKGINFVPVRNSHDRTILIKPSTFEGFKFKDLAYFYLALGVVIYGGIILYTNLFIGPAQLALIPEGYNPKPWEYHRHPITRFLAQYFVPSKQEIYERNLHNLLRKHEKFLLGKLENDVQKFMKERDDYQAWYFEKPMANHARAMKEHTLKGEEEKGKISGFIR